MFGGPQLSTSKLCIIPGRPCVSVFFKRTLVRQNQGSALLQGDFILTNYIYNGRFHKGPYSEVLGVGPFGRKYKSTLIQIILGKQST